ncbi:hypothetical protein Tco_1265217 [Tanacetum coccineum]
MGKRGASGVGGEGELRSCGGGGAIYEMLEAKFSSDNEDKIKVSERRRKIGVGERDSLVRVGNSNEGPGSIKEAWGEKDGVGGIREIACSIFYCVSKLCYQQLKTVTEASLRRHLKLEDADGISSLPNTEIFEQLALMGVQFCWVKDQQSQLSHITHPQVLQPPLSSPLRITLRQETKVPQPSSPSQTYDADEVASTKVDVKLGGAATTVSSLDAGHGSGNIDKTSSMPHDSPLSGGHTPRSDEGRMQQNELMDLVTKLSNIVLVLETDLKETKNVYSIAFIKLIMKVKKLEKIVKSNKPRRRAKFIISDDEEDLEDSSKQGRRIGDIDQDSDISLVHHDAYALKVAKNPTFPWLPLLDPRVLMLESKLMNL